MDQSKDITNHQKRKHLSRDDRYYLQGMLKMASTKPSLRKLAKELNCSPSTVRNELKRGAHPNTGKYSARRAQKDYDRKHVNSKTKFRRFVCTPFIEWVIEMVLDKKWSLDVCVGYARLKKLFPVEQMVCTKTLYNYVDLCLLKIRNLDLPLKVRRRKKHNHPRKHLKVLGRSIEERPEDVLTRGEFGHWEIDTVIGSKSKGDNVILTLCERKTRHYISLKIANKTAEAVTVGLVALRDYFGSKFSEIFKTITSDNGSEFADLAKLEQVEDTKVYFAHPYTSSERPSNERHNGLLRRFIPKGKRIDGYSEDEVLFVSDWCNDLPRKILGYRTSNELFDAELDRIYAA